LKTVCGDCETWVGADVFAGDMPNASYTLRRVIWPLWAWRAKLPDGTRKTGVSLGRSAARRAARKQIRRFRARSAPPNADAAPRPDEPAPRQDAREPLRTGVLRRGG
jgi:hypothetical protein